MPKRTDGFWLTNFLLLTLILLRYLPLVVGTKWLWGVGQQSLLSVNSLICNTVLLAAALVLPHLRSSERTAGVVIESFSQVFFDSKRRLYYRGIVVGAVTVLFVLFRMPTHFLGDGYTYLADLGSSTGHWTRWSEGGAMGIVLAIQTLFKERSEGIVEGIYQSLSILSGFISLWYYFLIANVVSQETTKRVLTFFVLILSPMILMFFGYVESYPVMLAPLFGSLYYSLRYAEEGDGLGLAVFLCLVAVALHLQAILLVPGIFYLMLSKGRGLKLFRKHKRLIVAGIIVSVGFVAFAFVSKLWSSFAVRNIFVPLLSGKPSYPGYTVLSTRHLSDILNLGLLVFPSGLLFMVIAVKRTSVRQWTQADWFLILVSAAGGAFLLLVDPILSMPRDWDLFSTCLIAPMLLVLRNIPESKSATIRRFAISIVLFSGVVCFSWLAITLEKVPSIRQTVQIIGDNPERSFGSLSILEMWCDKNGDTSMRDSLEARRVVLYPDFYRVREIFADLDNGELHKAESTLAYIRPDTYSKDYNQIMAEILLRRKRLDSALIFAKRTVDVQPSYDRGYVTLALIYYLRQEQDEAISALHRGYELNRESVPLLLGLAANYLSLGEFDSVMMYCGRVQRLNPNAAQSYFYQYIAYRELKNDSSAIASASKYLQIGGENPGYNEFRQVITGDYPQLDSIKPNSAWIGE
jgi:hypothetical protein